MMDSLVSYTVALVVIAIPLCIYLWRIRRDRARVSDSVEKGRLFSEGPRAQHPSIDVSSCIGCGSCVSVCPEGDVLAVIGGKAAIINGHKCIGHALCAEACPVGAITMVNAAPSMSADQPYLTPEYETNISNLFIAGELGGLALIRNAVNQGRDCIDTITGRIRMHAAGTLDADVYDVCIIGAGPAGISASLRAIENKLRYLTIEQSEIGGTVSKYPRQKLVMTSPVHFPLHGKFRKMALSKEEILAFWESVGRRADFVARTCEGVEDIRKSEQGEVFEVATAKGQYRAFAVVLALGRNGTPRKLEIKGEELPKVMYRLIEAEAYTHKSILVVGGGDSAIEAAMGLANQKGNEITLSYRQQCFSRLKERNMKRIEEYMSSGRIKVLFNSNPVEISEKSVLLDCAGTLKEIRNDFIWVFAGGVAPNSFLRKIGVQFGTQTISVDRQSSDLASAPR
jgi:thioredoxin reductase (NADPH)